MRWKLFVRRFHRWFSLFLGIQLLFWVLSGVYFSMVPLSVVRGEDRMQATAPAGLIGDRPFFPIEQLLARYNPDPPISAIQLRQTEAGPVYAVYAREPGPLFMVDALSGQELPLLTPEAAEQAARRDFKGDAAVEKVVLLQQQIDEYDDRLPVYQVHFADARRTRLYVSPVDGEVLKRRNRYWRIFDFLWMLHIMDYQTRNNFNNNLLRVMSVMGLLLIGSGYLLWASSRRSRPNDKGLSA